MKFIRGLAVPIAATVAFVVGIYFVGAMWGSSVRAAGSSAAADAVAINADAVQGDGGLSAALCQVVYPLDESAEEGYRYMFFGNGFFINDQGYIVTAAHLLGYFRNGGVPYILVGPPEGPRRMVEAPIVAADWEHDVAVLHAAPNPFQSDKRISYLRVSAETLARGRGVMSASLRPPDVQNAHSSVAPLEDFSRAEVIDYLFYRDKGAEQSELMLFNQDVVPGQSGSPLVSSDTHAVVGIVVGKWLHPTVIPSGAEGGHVTIAPGAALRIHYAIGLLEQLHVTWQSAANAAAAATTQAVARVTPQTGGPAAVPGALIAAARPAAAAPATAQAQPQNRYTPPSPLSVVGVPYPPQALFGGEVLLDALVDTDGKLGDVVVVNGDPPFLNVVLDAVRTWSFSPARLDGRAVEGRIGIAFQFPQSFLPAVTSRERNYKEPLADAAERGALPMYSIEPDYPVNSIAEGSVVLYGLVDSNGQLTSTSVVRNVDSLTATTDTAVHHWKFVPGKQAGAGAESAVVVVVTFRRPTQ